MTPQAGDSGPNAVAAVPLAARWGGLLASAVAARVTVGVAASIGLAAGGASAAWAGLQHQARLAGQRIGVPQTPPPNRDGVYGPSGKLRRGSAAELSALRLVMLGDSTSAGFGAADADSLPGVMLARELAATLRRPVHLRTVARVGSGAADLSRQTDQAVRLHPDLAIILVGPNDVRDRISPAISVQHLTDAVTRLRAESVTVVVGTCPDLGIITPIPQPLRQLAGRWSRSLAERQEKAVTRAGGVAVPIARLVSPDFLGHPELFAPDLFHPSGAGYAKAVAALLPVTLRALGHPVRMPSPAKRDLPVVTVPVVTVSVEPDTQRIS
jgi:lysophospholipase L1-like esterase